jgi:hypothetical protein
MTPTSKTHVFWRELYFLKDEEALSPPKRRDYEWTIFGIYPFPGWSGGLLGSEGKPGMCVIWVREKTQHEKDTDTRELRQGGWTHDY